MEEVKPVIKPGNILDLPSDVLVHLATFIENPQDMLALRDTCTALRHNEKFFHAWIEKELACAQTARFPQSIRDLLREVLPQIMNPDSNVSRKAAIQKFEDFMITSTALSTKASAEHVHHYIGYADKEWLCRYMRILGNEPPDVTQSNTRISELESFKDKRVFTVIAGAVVLAGLGVAAAIMQPPVGTVTSKVFIGLSVADVIISGIAVAARSYQVHKIRQTVFNSAEVAALPEAANNSVFSRFYKGARGLLFKSEGEQQPLLLEDRLERGDALKI